MPLESTFSYSNAPQPVVPKKKYRNQDEAGLTLMNDPRVRRGGTGSSSRQPTGRGPGRPKGDDTANDLTQTQAHGARKPTPSYEYHVAELVKPEIDLSQYLVERTDDSTGDQTQGQKRKQKGPKTAHTQTDEFEERPATPEFVPRKTGVDAHTQVEDVRELFDFDKEVAPMVAVLCAKTIEQALFELEGEGELVNLQQECDRFEAERLAEQQWARSKEQESIAVACTKDLALKALQREAELQGEVRRKVAGLAAMRQQLPSMLDDIYSELFSSGRWQHRGTVEVREVCLDVYQAAAQGTKAYKLAQDLVDELLMLAAEGKEGATEQTRGCPCGCGDKGKHKGLRLMVGAAELGRVMVVDGDSIDSLDRKIEARVLEEGLAPGTVAMGEGGFSVRATLTAALGLPAGEEEEGGLSRSAPLDCSLLPAELVVELPCL